VIKLPTSSMRTAIFYGVFALTSCVLPLAARANGDLARLAEQGRVEQLQQLLKSGTDVNSRLSDGSTALHLAVLRDQQDAVAALLDAGADPVLLNRNGISPLFLAVQNGNADIVSSLLKAGADPNTLSESGETILMTAAFTGKPEVVSLLLANGALVDARDPEFKQTALMIAVMVLKLMPALVSVPRRPICRPAKVRAVARKVPALTAAVCRIVANATMPRAA